MSVIEGFAYRSRLYSTEVALRRVVWCSARVLKFILYCTVSVSEEIRARGMSSDCVASLPLADGFARRIALA